MPDIKYYNIITEIETNIAQSEIEILFYSERMIFLKFLTLILLFIAFHFLVDGNFSEWSNWTICSVSCGKGVKRRTRNCTNPSLLNGANCTGNYTEQKVCNEGQCPGTITFYNFE